MKTERLISKIVSVKITVNDARSKVNDARPKCKHRPCRLAADGLLGKPVRHVRLEFSELEALMQAKIEANENDREKKVTCFSLKGNTPVLGVWCPGISFCEITTHKNLTVASKNCSRVRFVSDQTRGVA